VTLEEKLWNDLVRRKRFCTAQQLANKFMLPPAAARAFLFAWVERQILDVKVVNNKIFYRIKE